MDTYQIETYKDDGQAIYTINRIKDDGDVIDLNADGDPVTSWGELWDFAKDLHDMDFYDAKTLARLLKEIDSEQTRVDFPAACHEASKS